ncbi:YolD-like family protein [Paenibacillus illinoisensis]|uniref:YolD-like family protein n=1 Tax=Paenibacillus illinoisensis TaxID=59845 RepID=UPI003CF2E599
MAKKSIDNGLFESSRLILKEHKVAWLTQQEQILEKKIPVLDGRELEQIHRTLIDSYNRRLRIRITVFDPIEDKVYEGIVSTINTYLREIKLVWGKGDYKFIDIEKIISVRI